jgi:hypothetical protein
VNPATPFPRLPQWVGDKSALAASEPLGYRAYPLIARVVRLPQDMTVCVTPPCYQFPKRRRGRQGRQVDKRPRGAAKGGLGVYSSIAIRVDGGVEVDGGLPRAGRIVPALRPRRPVSSRASGNHLGCRPHPHNPTRPPISARRPISGLRWEGPKVTGLAAPLDRSAWACRVAWVTKGSQPQRRRLSASERPGYGAAWRELSAHPSSSARTGYRAGGGGVKNSEIMGSRDPSGPAPGNSRLVQIR